MSALERCCSLLPYLSAEMLAQALGYIERLVEEEKEDDEFCARLYERYLEEDDGGEAVPLEDFAAQLGISLDED